MFDEDGDYKGEGKWQLRVLMKKLIVDYDCDPTIKTNQNEECLVSYCMKNKKYQAFKILLTLCKEKLKLNYQNKDNTTLYGRAIIEFVEGA